MVVHSAVFTAQANGARPIAENHPRVAIVVTDGKSNQPSLTISSANRVHDHDITMIAVGIGASIDLQELEVIASEPECLHLFLLKDFTEVESLKYSIEKRTCDGLFNTVFTL